MKQMKVVTAVVIEGIAYITARGAARSYASCIAYRLDHRKRVYDYHGIILRAARRTLPLFERILP